MKLTPCWQILVESGFLIKFVDILTPLIFLVKQLENPWSGIVDNDGRISCCKNCIMMKLDLFFVSLHKCHTTVVNLTNILCHAFSYESIAGSFFCTFILGLYFFAKQYQHQICSKNVGEIDTWTFYDNRLLIVMINHNHIFILVKGQSIKKILNKFTLFFQCDTYQFYHKNCI